MSLALAGMPFVVVGIALVVYRNSRDRNVPRIVTMPVMEALLPVIAVSGIALGLAMLVAGILT